MRGPKNRKRTASKFEFLKIARTDADHLKGRHTFLSGSTIIMNESTVSPSHYETSMLAVDAEVPDGELLSTLSAKEPIAESNDHGASPVQEQDAPSTEDTVESPEEQEDRAPTTESGDREEEAARLAAPVEMKKEVLAILSQEV